LVKCAREGCEETFLPRGSGKTAKRYCSIRCGDVQEYKDHPGKFHLRHARYYERHQGVVKARGTAFRAACRATNTATMVALIRRNGCPVCGPIEGYIDSCAFAFHHFDPAEKDGLLSLELSPPTYNAGLPGGAHLHLGCHERLHSGRHLGKSHYLRDPLPGETRESQFHRIAAGCIAEVEEEKKAQGFFLA